MVQKNMSSTEILTLATGREREANKWYRQAADLTEDKNGKSTFTWLAKEELRHLAKLRKQLKSVQEGQGWAEWKSLVSPVTRADFPPMSEAEGPYKAGAEEREALGAAIENEKKSLAFYKSALAATADLNGKEMFAALAKEEEGHLALLEEELKWINQSRKYFTLHHFPPRD